MNIEKINVNGTVNDIKDVEDVLAEKARAQAAEQLLQNNIGAEKSRAEGAEAQLGNAVAIEVARAQTAEGKLREGTTARFARFVESASISTGEPDSFKEVVYIKSANKFAAADDGNAYWDTWNGMDEYMNGNEVRKDKVYLCGNDIYVWNNSGLSVLHSDLYHIQITKRTDIVIVETPARKGGVIKASDGFGGYHFDLSNLYAEGYRSIRFRGANYTIENDIVRGVVVAKDGAVESFIETVAAKTNGWNELPIKPNSSYLWASYTKASPVLYGELFTPEYIEIMKPSGIVPTLNQKVDSVVGNLQRVGSINMLNPYDLLKGYSLSSGMIVQEDNGIFSNKLTLDVNKVYSFVNIPLFSGTSANDTVGTIFVAKYNSSDEFIGRDFSLAHKVEDGYATATYTPTDPNVSYYRILLQSGSNVNYPFDSSKAMIYCGELHLDFIPYKDDLLRSYFDMQQDARLNALESAVEQLCLHLPKSKNNILLTGASFADGNYNQWFKIVCEKLGVTGYNKAVSGESIVDTAIKLNSNTLYSFEEFEDFETLLIMHVHNRDVCDNIGLQDDYKNYIVSNTMSYSQAYDYVLKKYAADCYAAKDNSASKWYGSKCGKPCRVVCMTHWHDARTIFNDSIRKLRDKWGFELIELDKYIGFTKHQLHPISGQQQSVIHAVDTEVIDGVTYGWHPLRTDGVYIQDKIAGVVVKYIKE